MTKWTIRNNGNQAGADPSRIVELLLDQRGFVDHEERARFLYPRLAHLRNPLKIPDMPRAVERLRLALERDERILVFTDYDVDGISSGALFYKFMTGMGADVRVFIPDRVSEGYGLTLEALQRALGECPASLVVALDCGTTSAEEVVWLKERGIDAIIVDHHELPQSPPKPLAFVNPQRGGDEPYLATVGLVFKLCHAFLKMEGDPSLFDLKRHLDLVALGTVADLAPLIHDNRILVKHGLEGLAQTTHFGVQALAEVAGIKHKPTPATIGFILGPRLNACGRLSEAIAGWELLTTNDRDRASALARQLDQLNRQRQRLEQSAYDEAAAMLGQEYSQPADRCLVVASEDWHQGVVGIVASRLQKSLYKPAIVISLMEGGLAKGSGRSIEGISLMDALRGCSDYLEGFGGHAMAAGLEIRGERIMDFRRAINAWFRDNAKPDAYQERVMVDMELPGSALTDALAEELTRLEPFGQKNRPPIFMVREVRIRGRRRVFGERHVKFRAEVGDCLFDVVGFGHALAEFPASGFDLAGHWEIDDYNGQSIFRMVDWRTSQKNGRPTGLEPATT